MVIECLRFWVPPDTRAVFLETDATLWTPALARCAGYRGKEVWLNPERPDEVCLIIRWENRQSWQCVDPNYLETIEAQFSQAMRPHPYRLIECSEYQVERQDNRRYPTSS